MSEQKHTPGPWEVAKTGTPLNINTVARVGYLYVHAREGFGDIRADARLIAAAPDLLAACEAAHQLKTFVANPSAWETYDDEMSERLRALAEVVEAAIAKAKGAP